MHPCPGCGFKNRPDRDSCLKCGQVFREKKDLKPLLRKIGSAVVGVVMVGALLLKVFGPSKMEAKMKRFEEREARKTEAARTEAPRPVSTAPKAAPVDPPPPRKVAEPEEPSREARGAALLRRADELYEKGDYAGAAAATQEAAALGVRSPESQARKKILADVSTIVMYRDYMDRENLLDPARLVAGKANLELIDPAALPTAELRDTLRTTLARVTKAHNQLVGGDRGSSSAPSPPNPSGPDWRIPDAGWKDTFLLKPVSPRKGMIQGSLFTEVVSDSLVWKAGIREGDVMVEFNGEPVTTVTQMVNLKTRIERDRGFWGVVRRGDIEKRFRVEFPDGR